MAAYLFPSEESLQLALTGGMIPEEVQAQPLAFVHEPEGSIWVSPEKKLPRTVRARLQEAGIPEVPARRDASEALTWPAVVRTKRVELETDLGLVLFVAPGDGRGLLELAGQMLRLGCDRQELRNLERGRESLALLRVAAPPYYALLAALDHVDGLRAFAPSPPGQERVWTEVGHSHPLATTIRPADGALTLIPAQGPWLSLSDGAWTSLYEQLELQVAAPSPPWKPVAPAGRLSVKLKLGRAPRPQPASLWLVRENAVAQVEQFVRGLPEEALTPLLFAVASTPGREPLVLIKSRVNRDGPAAVVPPGEPYAPLLELRNLFAPAESIVEPPLRRDRLRDLLAPDVDQLTWLSSAADGSLARESLAESAFAPLSEWIDYVVGHAGAALEPWVKGAIFDFDAFRGVSAPSAVVSGREEAAPARRAPKREEPLEREERPAPRPAAATAPAPRLVSPLLAKAPASKPEELGVAELELSRLEGEFLALNAPLDAPARRELWLRMAGLHLVLSHPADLGLCFTHALWESPTEEAQTLARRWAEAEAALLSSRGPVVPELLARPNPSGDEARALVAQLVSAWLGRESFAQLHEASLWLDAHDDKLDVRSYWLGRAALASLSGGDRLGLAKARDRALARLHRGLSLERDLPRFLKLAGDGGRSREAGAAAKLSAQLELMLGRIQSARRKRSAVEAPPASSLAYVGLVFAYGFARLGQAPRARALRESCQAALDLKDPVHGFLARAYGARIEHALEGRAPGTPLPPELAGELNSLEPFLRYKVDRLRQHSSVLEPQERLDPLSGFLNAGKDPRGEALASLRGMTDVDALAAAVGQLLNNPPDSPQPRAALFDGLLDFLPLLPESSALPLLTRMVESLNSLPAELRLRVLEDALKVAGHFNRESLVKQLLAQLRALLSQLSPSQSAEVASVMAAGLRSLRRVGLRNEASALLESATAVATGTDATGHVARVTLAGGHAYLGQMEAATALFDRAYLKLADGATPMIDRLAVSRALALALGHTPVDYAVAGLERLSQQLPIVTDSFNTNSHFCLSLIAFADALVLGYASDDLALGETGRRFVEEDEHRVRRRIHRDLETL